MRDSPEEQAEDERIVTDDFAAGQRVPREAEWEVVAQAPFDRTESSGLTTTIVFAVADAEGVSPGDVKSPPLYDVVDTAALEAAFFSPGDEARGPDVRCSTEFMYRGHRIVVRDDGWVLVHERVDEPG